MKRPLLIAFNALIYLFILAPILVVIPVSFSATQYLVFPPRGLSLRWYVNFFTTPELVDALWLSLRVAVWATAISTVIGTLAALALTRYRFPGRGALRELILAPIVIPRLVLGIALLIFLSRTFLSGDFGGLLVAHVLVAFPYVVRTVSASLFGFDRTLEEAGASLGAAPLTVFRTVVLPLLKPGIAAGAIFAFVTSFDELVMTLFLAGPRTTTLPVKIFNYIEYTSDPTIAAISVILIAITAIAVVVTERIVGFGQFV
jgi:putative spermidine/putrescine transport system permease protein